MSDDDRKPLSLAERWRREAAHHIEEERLQMALEVLPAIRTSMLRIRAGSISTEIIGALGAIHETSIHVRTLSMKEWPKVVRVLKRSGSIVEALEQARVPRSFDRLVARIMGEPLFPESRRVSWACTCDTLDDPCPHVLALQELFARTLEEKPWQLLVLRGVDLHATLAKVKKTGVDENLPPLAFGAKEEPVLYPEGEDVDLDITLTPAQVDRLNGKVSVRVETALHGAINTWITTTPDAKDAMPISAPTPIPPPTQKTSGPKAGARA